MQELIIEPSLWRFAGGWMIVAAIVGASIGAALQFIPNMPKGAATGVFVCVAAIFGAGAYFGEFVDLTPTRAVTTIQKQAAELSVAATDRAMKRPRAGIRINNESQRTAAAQMETLLKRNGVIVDGIEMADPKDAPASLEVRYFRQNDARSADALSRIVGGGIVGVPGFPTAPAGLVDIWLPKR